MRAGSFKRVCKYGHDKLVTGFYFHTIRRKTKQKLAYWYECKKCAELNRRQK